MNAQVKTLQNLDRELKALELDAHRLGKIAGWLTATSPTLPAKEVLVAQDAIAKLVKSVDAVILLVSTKILETAQAIANPTVEPEAPSEPTEEAKAS